MTLASIMLILVASLLPSVSYAASSKVTCALEVTTEQGTVDIEDNATVLLVRGTEVEIVWDSTHAKKAFDGDGDKIKLEGTATMSPTTTSTYAYTFTNGSKKATCEVTIQVVEGTFKSSTLSTSSSKPKISGTASGTKSVQLYVYKEGTTKPLYTSNVIKVKKDAWSTTVSKKLKNGTYTVVLVGEKNTELNTIATSTLTIGKKATSESVSATTFVAQSVPLLLGGTAKPNSSVAISFLQVINIGKTSGVVEGFSVKQTGSASTKAIIGFTISDDRDTTSETIGGSEGTVLFKDGVAVLPLHTTIAAGDMRLFTLKAILSKNASEHIGKQLKLQVSAVDTNGTLSQSTLPIRGVTWTIGY